MVGNADERVSPPTTRVPLASRWATSAAEYTEDPNPDDPFEMINELEYVSDPVNDDYFQFAEATYSIVHNASFKRWAGPMDEHSKMNLNAADPLSLNLLEDITPDVVAAILDWLDENDEPSLLGAEREWYLSQDPPYEPRNGPFRSVAELELVAGIWGDFVRGEDRNLNGRLDPNEDDGERAMPSDNADGVLDAGWSEWLTVHSVAGGATDSGEPRIHLRWADAQDLVARCSINEAQAKALINFGREDQAPIEQLLTVPLSTLAAASGGAGAAEPIEDLTDDQLRSVLAETSMYPPFERRPGKININTAPEDLIEDLLLAQNFNTILIDSIIFLRNSRLEGITSLLDLYEIVDVTPEIMDQLARNFTTTSNVYTIAARGKSLVSGTEVEMIVRVDRSNLPIRIIEYREQ